MLFLLYSDSNLPLPAGVVTLSPLLDDTGSFPSTRVDTGLDWLPCLHKHPYIPKPSPAWPPAKPRFDFYTDIPLHPLVYSFVTSRTNTRYHPCSWLANYHRAHPSS